MLSCFRCLASLQSLGRLLITQNINKNVNVIRILKHLNTQAASFKLRNRNPLNKGEFCYYAKISRNAHELHGQIHKSDSNEHAAAVQTSEPSLNFVQKSLSVRDDDDAERSLIVFVQDSMTNMKAKELYKLIRKMKPEEILLLAKHSHKNLNKTHLALCLKNLYRLAESKPPIDQQEFIENVKSDPSFGTLCSAVVVNAHQLEASVFADMLEYLVYFGYDSHDDLMKIMLSLAGHFINDLALDQLVTVANSLTALTVSDQTRLLTEAVRTLCQIRPGSDRHSLQALSEWHKIQLIDAFGNSLPYVGELLRDVWRNRYALQRDYAYSVALLRAMSRCKVSRHVAMTWWCVDNIDRHFNRLSADEIEIVTTACSSLGLYVPILYEPIGQFVLEWGDASTQLSTWSKMADRGYLHAKLTDSVLESITNGSLDIDSVVTIQSFGVLLKHLADSRRCVTISGWEGLEGWIERNVNELIVDLSYGLL